MGTYHTFFVATDEELDARFPGWKRVKPEKIVRKTVNPFTKEAMTLTEWPPVEEPEDLGSPSFLDDAWGPPLQPIVEEENDYMRGVERECPPGLRSLPHFRAKNVDALLSYEPLTKALAGEDVDAPPARIGHDEDFDAPQVGALPLAMIARLAELKDEQLLPIAAALLVDFGSGQGADDETRAWWVERVLGPLRSLAVEATKCGGLVCHHYALHP